MAERFILAGVGDIQLFDQSTGEIIVTSKTLTASGSNFSVTAEDIAAALTRVYNNVFPIHSTEDIVGLNEIQCGNPGLYAISTTNAAMAEYMRTLFTAEEAAEIGIGKVYEKWW